MENNEKTLQKPAFWRVLFAYALDGFILLSMAFTIFIGVALSATLNMGPALLDKMLDVFKWTMVYIMPVLYFSGLEGSCGGSTGKMALNLFVTSARKPIFVYLLMSYMIDMAVALILAFACIKWMQPIYAPEGWSVGAIIAGGVYNCLFGMLVIITYFSLSEGVTGTSLGKICMGVSVHQK